MLSAALLRKQRTSSFFERLYFEISDRSILDLDPQGGAVFGGIGVALDADALWRAAPDPAKRREQNVVFLDGIDPGCQPIASGSSPIVAISVITTEHCR
jgi:hypothetical protein